MRQDRGLKVETTLSDLADMYRDTSLEIVNISASRSDAPLCPEDGKPAERYVFMRRLHSPLGPSAAKTGRHAIGCLTWYKSG